MHFGDNIPRPNKVYLVMNEKQGGVFDKETRPRQGGQARISPSVFLYLTSKGLFSNLLFHFELTLHFDLTWSRTFGGPYKGLYRDIATVFNRWWHKTSGQEESEFYFWNFILCARTVGSCLREWHPCFSI
jgi:hypothetical protein